MEYMSLILVEPPAEKAKLSDMAIGPISISRLLGIPRLRVCRNAKNDTNTRAATTHIKIPLGSEGSEGSEGSSNYTYQDPPRQ